ncbi:MAG: hypothetical protein HYV27_20560 [Candidatus Hydrogenedentes bacterium]|nr:hypothetical protein [Candidatus Hydrogenedentota bacterium]
MLKLFRHLHFMRCVSVLTLVAFIPNSVQAWYFLPAAHEIHVAAGESTLPLAAGAAAPPGVRLAAARIPGPLDAPAPELPERVIPAELDPEILAKNAVSNLAQSESLYNSAALTPYELDGLHFLGKETPVEEPQYVTMPKVDYEVVKPADAGQTDSERLGRFLVSRVYAAPSTEPAIRVYAGSTQTQASQELAEADALLQSGELGQAWTLYRQLAANQTDMQAQGAAKESLAYIVEQAQREEFALEAMSKLADVLAPYGELQSAGERLDYVSLMRHAGNVARRAGSAVMAADYYTSALNAAISFVYEEERNAPAQIHILNSAVEVARFLGHETREYVRGHLEALVQSSEPVSVLKLAAREAFSRYTWIEEKNGPEQILQMANLLEEFENPVIQEQLSSSTLTHSEKAQLAILKARAFHTLVLPERAQIEFERIIEAYPQAEKEILVAEYYKAFLHYSFHKDDLPGSAQAMVGYVTKFPDSPYRDTALWVLSSLDMQAENFDLAAEALEELINSHPNSEYLEQARELVGGILEQHELKAHLREQEARRYLESTKYAKACGPFALQYLLAERGTEIELDALMEMCKTDETGTSMAALQSVASELGVPLQGIRTQVISELQFPFIAHVNNNHYVLVRSANERMVTIADASRPSVTVPLDSFMAVWGGAALIESAEPHVASLSHENLSELRGGFDILPSDVTNNNNVGNCDNTQSDCGKCEKCCDGAGGGGGGGGGTNSRGRMPGENSQESCDPPPSGGNTPPPPPKDSPCPGCPSLGSNRAGIGIASTFNPFTMSYQTDSTDLNLDVRGPMGIHFARTYMDLWGDFRGYLESKSKPYFNNIGKSWSHNWNLHLRTSTEYGMVVFVSDRGDGKLYSRVSTNVGGWDYYKRATDAGRTNERSIELRRNRSTGVFEMTFTSGLVMHFSAPTTDGYAYSRLEKVRDVNYSSTLANEITLTYNTSGYLTRIDTPTTADDRYLQFDYTNGLITTASIKDGTGTLKHVDYTYSNDLLINVKVDDDPDSEYVYEYATNYETDTGSGYYVDFLSSVTKPNGVETTVAHLYEYGHSPAFWSPETTTFTHADGIQTVFYKVNFGNSHQTDVSNLDGSTVLNKYTTNSTYEMRGVSYYDIWMDPNSKWAGTYDFNFGHNSYGDLTSRPGVGVDASYTYNADGRLTAAGASGQPQTAYTYTGKRLTKMTSPEGIETNYTYDSKGQLTRVTYPAIVQNPIQSTDGIFYTYDAYGQVETYKDPLGEVWEYEYDIYGNRTKTTSPEGVIQQWEYDKLGRVTKSIDGEGQEVTYGYGSTGGCGACGGSPGALISVTNESGNTTDYEYNVHGDIVKVTDANDVEHTKSYTYDAAGRVTAITEDGHTSTIEYDKLGRVVRTESPSGDEVVRDYDVLGRLIRVTDAIGAEEYEYDATGQLTKVTDKAGHETVYAYSNGRLVTTTDAESKVVKNFYDSYGRLTKTGANASGTADPVEYFYSSTTGQMNKKTMGSYTGTNEVEYYFDRAGRTNRVDDWMGGASSGNPGHDYEYDGDGRVLRYRDFDDDQTASPTVDRYISHTYDGNGRVLTRTDFHGNTTTYTYTPTGRVNTITAPGSKVWTFYYDDLDRLTSYDEPNGLKVLYTYDEESRLNRIEHKDGTTVLEGWEYSFALDGNIDRIKSVLSEQAWDYAYDGGERLVSAVRSDDGGFPTVRYGYTYDAGGNMLSKSENTYDVLVNEKFTDNNYTANPAWTVTGTWSAASGYMENTAGSSPEFSLLKSHGDAAIDYSFQIGSDATAASSAGLRFRDDNASPADEVHVVFYEAAAYMVNYVSGSSVFLDGDSDVDSAPGVTYFVRVIATGSHIEVWRGLSTGTMEKVMETDSAGVASGAQVAFYAGSSSVVRFDDIRVTGAYSGAARSFADDFEDGNYTANPTWTPASGSWTVAGSTDKYLANTSDGARLRKASTAVDGELRLDYLMDVGSTFDDRLYVFPRFVDDNNYVSVVIFPDRMELRNKNNGALNYINLLSADTALDTWYNLSVRVDGSRLEVWRGTAGGTMELLGALNSVTMMSSAYIQLQTLSVSRYWVDDVVFTTADPHSVSYAYNDANEMTSMTEDGVTTSFTYDDWGRLSTKTQGSYAATYYYRYGDKLKMVTSTFPGEAALVEYMYDGLGKRRFKVVNSSEWTWYRWDLGWNVIAEYDDYPGTTSIWDVGALERTYTHTPGGSVSRILADVGGTAPATGNYQYYFHDHLGSTRALHNQSKAMIASNEHTPYGDVYAASGAPMPHTFTGKSYDAEAGLYYFPYRYYSPGMGRWTTRDPLGMVDGPNVYGYARGNVAALIDPTGRSVVGGSGITVRYGDGSCLNFDRMGHDTIPSEEMREMLKCISREMKGKCLTITGGTRPPSSPHYKKGTQHSNGNAADVDPDAGPGFWCAAKGCGAKFAIDESDHFHVDLGPDRSDKKYGNELRGCDCDG